MQCFPWVFGKVYANLWRSVTILMALSNAALERTLGYEFNAKEHLVLALTHRSCGKLNNERLEFLGDSVLNQVVAQELFFRFPDSREGELSRLRASLVKGPTLAQVALEIDLGDYVLLGPGELKSGGFRRESILGDCLEAVLGAILVDGGYQACRECVISLFEARLDESVPGQSKDSKTRLQEYLQGHGHALPEYQLLDVSGDDHEQSFRVACHIAEGSGPFIGEGSSRRRAEQGAAGAALAAFETAPGKRP